MYNTIYALCGIPGSGKTTLSRQLASEYNIKALYSYDEFEKAQKTKENKQIHQCLYEQLHSDLLEGHSIIVDDLHVTKKRRMDLLTAIKDAPCKKILIVMTTPLEECLRRNSQREGQARLPDFVIYHLNHRYQQPSLDEGWDDIWYFK